MSFLSSKSPLDKVADKLIALKYEVEKMDNLKTQVEEARPDLAGHIIGDMSNFEILLIYAKNREEKQTKPSENSQESTEGGRKSKSRHSKNSRKTKRKTKRR